jgi:hypothetical protein
VEQVNDPMIGRRQGLHRRQHDEDHIIGDTIAGLAIGGQYSRSTNRVSTRNQMGYPGVCAFLSP